MQTPSTAELHAAIQVLKKLGERINHAATHTKLQLSESCQGNHLANQVEVASIDQTTRIEIVAAQLKHWRDELLQQQKQTISYHV